jgi:hypothetical protein
MANVDLITAIGVATFGGGIFFGINGVGVRCWTSTVGPPG